MSSSVRTPFSSKRQGARKLNRPPDALDDIRLKTSDMPRNDERFLHSHSFMSGILCLANSNTFAAIPAAIGVAKDVPLNQTVSPFHLDSIATPSVAVRFVGFGSGFNHPLSPAPSRALMQMT